MVSGFHTSTGIGHMMNGGILIIKQLKYRRIALVLGVSLLLVLLCACKQPQTDVLPAMIRVGEEIYCSYEEVWKPETQDLSACEKLGVLTSAVLENESPKRNLETNRGIQKGATVYRWSRNELLVLTGNEYWIYRLKSWYQQNPDWAKNA